MKSGYNVLCASRGIDVSGGCINVMEEAADPELESLLFDPCCCLIFCLFDYVCMMYFEIIIESP